MTRILATTILSLAAASPLAFADGYSVFKVCQDQRVLHTSDGADAGHIDYIVVDPSNQQVISTVVTGGVIGDKHVVVPISEMSFDQGSVVTFTQIDRERFVAAPVIETTRFSSNALLEPAIIAPSFTHFGVDIHQTTINNRTDINRTNVTRTDANQVNAARANGGPNAARAEAPGQHDPNQPNAAAAAANPHVAKDGAKGAAAENAPAANPATAKPADARDTPPGPKAKMQAGEAREPKKAGAEAAPGAEAAGAAKEGKTNAADRPHDGGKPVAAHEGPAAAHEGAAGRTESGAKGAGAGKGEKPKSEEPAKAAQ